MIEQKIAEVAKGAEGRKVIRTVCCNLKQMHVLTVLSLSNVALSN